MRINAECIQTYGLIRQHAVTRFYLSQLVLQSSSLSCFGLLLGKLRELVQHGIATLLQGCGRSDQKCVIYRQRGLTLNVQLANSFSFFSRDLTTCNETALVEYGAL